MTQSISILVIDDSEDDRLLYSRTLQKNADTQYKISEADDGDAGMRQMHQNPPDCVLLDYSLPGRNGIEVLKRIRSQHPFIPVVMLTGQGNEKVAVAAMQHGAQNYISKTTITAETLEHVIRMAIEHCMLQKRIHEQRTSLEVFTRALAHDLKEPVRTIRSFADLILRNEQFSDKTMTHFQFIQKAADRMHTLIDTVFLYTRLDAPGEIAKESCDTEIVLQEARENLARLIQESNATITYGLLPTLYANRMQLMQVLQNLISNAIHHGEKVISIHVDAAIKDDYWLLSVSDNGPGIEEAYLDKIFDPFKRMACHDEERTGLGLAICRKIVESHAGKIWCESTVGKGATFFFTMPKIVVMPSKIRSVSPQTNDVEKPVPNGKPLANILLVDDNRADIEMALFRLIEHSQLHCNLFVASDGDAALARLRNQSQEVGPIDLVLLDINMPEMDGFEILERIRSEDALRHLSVVMCTGSTYDKDMARAQALGAVGYLTKPIEFAKLKSIINKITHVQICPEDNGYSLLRTG